MCEAIYEPRPTDIVIENKENDFILKNGNNYYMFCFNLNIKGDSNVVIDEGANYEQNFKFSEKISRIEWLDSGEELAFTMNGNEVSVKLTPYDYGQHFVVRVAKITV